jgi:hypothetical protein
MRAIAIGVAGNRCWDSSGSSMRASEVWDFVGTPFPIKAQVRAIKGFVEIIALCEQLFRG